MKLRFEVDQADSFRRGIDRAKSIVSIEVNPADLSEDIRSLIAEHLVGIDLLQFFYHNGDVIKGYPIMELTYTSREPRRIVAKAVNIEAVCEAIRANDDFIARIKATFNHPVQFRLIDKPPKNEGDFALISDQRPAQIQELLAAIRHKRRVCADCFLADIQNMRQDLHAHSYIVYMLPLLPSTATGRFYCEPVFAADFNGRTVVAHTPQIILNDKTGRIVEAMNLFHALDIYLLSGFMVDDLNILEWRVGKWGIISPEELLNLANARKPSVETAAGLPTV